MEPLTKTQALVAHDAFVRKLARQLLQNDADADDAAQHAWTRWLQTPPKAAASLRAWFAAVLYNYTRDVVRSSKRRSERERAGARDEYLPSTEDVVAREAARKLVIDAVLHLEEPWRTTLLLHYFDGRTVREIAHICNVPVETVRTRVRRGLALARARLDRTHGGDRKHWCAHVAVLAFAAPPAGFVILLNFLRDTTQTIVMASTKTKIAAGAAVIALLTSAIWYMTGDKYIVEQNNIPLATAEDAARLQGREAATASNVNESTDRETAGPTAPRRTINLQKGRGFIGGRVVEADGRPVSGARVDRIGASHEFLTSPGELFMNASEAPAPVGILDSAVTGSDGRFQFSKVAANESWLIGVNLGAPRPTLRFLDASPSHDETVELGDIVLDAKRSFSGRICYSDGAPAAGASLKFTNLPAPISESGMEYLTKGRSFIVDSKWLGAASAGMGQVVFTPPAWMEGVYSLFPLPSAVADANGNFSIEDAPAGSFYILADPRSSAPARFGPIVANETAAARPQSYILPKGISVSGTVVDPTGVPIPNAEVWPAAPSVNYPDNLAFLLKSVRAGADGKFNIENFHGSLIRFSVRAPGVATWSVGPLLETSYAKIELVTIPTSNATVRVVNDQNKPVDATLTILQIDGQAPARELAKASVADLVESELVTSESALMTQIAYESEKAARRDAWAAAVTSISQQPENKGVAFAFSSGIRLESAFVNLQAGNRLLHFSGFFESPPNETYLFARRPVKAKITRIDEGVYKIEGLGPGSYKILARNSDYSPGQGILYISGGEEATTQIALAAANKFIIHISSGEGAASRPVSGARATLVRNNSAAPLARAIDGSAVTGSDGILTFSAPHPGSQEIVISHPDFAPFRGVAELPNSPELYVSLNAGGEIRGKILFGNSPPRNPLAVFLQPNDASPFISYWRATTAADGSFSWKHVPAGYYTILSGDRLFPLPNGAGDVLSDWLATHAREAANCNVRAGETTNIIIDLLHPDRPAFKGIITINGAPAAGHIFSVSGQFGGSPRFETDKNGAFDLGPADPDHYQIRLYPKGDNSYPLAVREATVVKGDPFCLYWNMITGKVEGTIRSADGSIAPHAIVIARMKVRDKSLQIERRFDADENGHFITSDLAPGDYYIYSVFNNQRALPVTALVMEGSTSTANIHLQKCHNIAGSIDGVDFTGAQQAILQLRPLDNADPFAVREVEVDFTNKKFYNSGLRGTRYSTRLRVAFDDGAEYYYHSSDVQLPADGELSLIFEKER